MFFVCHTTHPFCVIADLYRSPPTTTESYSVKFCEKSDRVPSPTMVQFRAREPLAKYP